MKGEIRREDEHRSHAADVFDKELELALLLANQLTARFDASKYRDSYREKLDELIAAKLQGMPSTERDAPPKAPVVNILDALQRSLQSTARKASLSDTPVVKTRRREPRATKDAARNLEERGHGAKSDG